MRSRKALPPSAFGPLPDRFYFLDHVGKPSLEELPQFKTIRAFFLIDDAEFFELAARVLNKAMRDGQLSTAKSGSIMAFEGKVMTKTVTDKEAHTLLSILDPYIDYLSQSPNLPDFHGSRIGSLLPRFLGAYVYRENRGFFSSTRKFVIMNNVFAGIPSEELSTIERFDLKGSADDRSQRKIGQELMDFDLLRVDRKLVPKNKLEGERMLAQLERDVRFMVTQHMHKGPMGIVDWDLLPEFYAGEPGLMDYSLIVGLVTDDTVGGVTRIQVQDERVELRLGDKGRHEWHVTSTTKVAIVGIVDVLQFWTPAKRIANHFKRTVGMEIDGGRDCCGKIIDTVWPSYYGARFLRFLRELFTRGSWVESLEKMHGGNWQNVLVIQIDQLPDAQRKLAQAALALAMQQPGEFVLLPSLEQTNVSCEDCHEESSPVYRQTLDEFLDLGSDTPDQSNVIENGVNVSDPVALANFLDETNVATESSNFGQDPTEAASNGTVDRCVSIFDFLQTSEVDDSESPSQASSKD